MAKKKAGKTTKAVGTATNQGMLSGGWAGATLRTLVSIFVIAIVFGVFLDATVVSNSTLLNTQPYSQSLVVSKSANAVNDVATNTLSVTFTGDYANFTASNPLTITLTGNGITTYGTNTAVVAPAANQIQTFTITNSVATQTLTSTTGNFFNITNVALSLATPSTVPGTLTATITQSYLAANPKSVPWANTVNTISASATLTTTAYTIGGSSPSAIYMSLIGYLVTLANFVGIIILLVIIMIVILVIYALFAPIGGTAGMGAGMNI